MAANATKSKPKSKPVILIDGPADPFTKLKEQAQQANDATLVARVLKARRVSVPILSITTADPGETIAAITKAANPAPVIAWDIVRGFLGHNESGIVAVKSLIGELDPTKSDPQLAIELALRLPEGAVLFVHLAPEWLKFPGFVQAVWNLRDQYKGNHRLLVLLGVQLTLPAALTNDVISFDEPLPAPEELAAIVEELHTAAEMPLDLAREFDVAIREHATEALTGLSAFQAEQVAALCLTKAGLDLDALWERKRRTIEQTPGLKVWRGGERFDSIGGVEVVKDFTRRIVTGNARPNAIVFIDEIEKMLAGSAGDTSGVSQDQLGQILSYMQDQNASGMIFIGPPGAAKSAVAKAAGNEAGIPTIQLDLGGAKGSLVGESEEKLRQALKVISAVSNGRSLWIATCNRIGSLPPELRRRFTCGTFFFDLPSIGERWEIWRLYQEQYRSRGVPGISKEESGLVELPWTGAEIRQCFDLAWRLGCTLTEASAFIVPVAIAAADAIEQLRQQADGRFLSASYGGPYRLHRDPSNGQTRPGRKLEL